MKFATLLTNYCHLKTVMTDKMQNLYTHKQTLAEHCNSHYNSGCQ